MAVASSDWLRSISPVAKFTCNEEKNKDTRCKRIKGVGADISRTRMNSTPSYQPVCSLMPTAHLSQETGELVQVEERHTREEGHAAREVDLLRLSRGQTCKKNSGKGSGPSQTHAVVAQRTLGNWKAGGFRRKKRRAFVLTFPAWMAASVVS